MNIEFTKGAIDRLGTKIRTQDSIIDEDTLTELQVYRTSHKDSLAHTFNILCGSAKNVHHSSIVTFRIKRFESIIGKLTRYPDMRFSRMWDVAGCRCILRDEDDVYKLKKLIEENPLLTVVKEYDYIQKPQDDGYRSLHLFIKHFASDKIVEVQIRSHNHHNWATLVEISDLLFDSKLKEFGENKDLFRLHYLLSCPDALTVSDKYEIAKIIKEYNYFEKLSEVFSRNYLKVRKQWFDLQSKSSHKYFLIETKKDDVPRIESFLKFNEAEDTYFNVYKTRQNANIVLTHLQKPSYKQISIAYSNYILTFHSFLQDSLKIIESLIIESLEKRKHQSFFKNYHQYYGLIFNHIENLVSEIKEVQDFKNMNRTLNRLNKRKEKEWMDDIKKQITQLNNQGKKLESVLRDGMPNNYFEKFVVKQIIKNITNNYRRKTEKLVKSAGLNK